jgi:hypothetical protein
MSNKVITGGVTTSLHTLKYADIYAFVDSVGAPRHLLYDVAGSVCDTFNQNYKKSLMYLLEEAGSTRTTGANWVGHREATRTYKNFTILAATVGSGAGAAKLWTVAPGSHFQGRVLAQVGDQLQIAGSRIFVQVIGKDSGGTNHKLGVDTAGAAFVAGALGGTSTAIKLVVKPIIATDTVPVMLTTDLITNLSTSVGIGSCPVDGIVKDDDEYKFGFSYVRSSIEFTGNTRYKEVACTYKGAAMGKTFVDTTIGDNIINHYRKIQNKLMFIPNSTNTGLTNNGEERDESNALIPQIQQNGGLTTTYTTWTFANFKTIVRYLKNQGGSSKYMIKGGYDFIAAMMDDLRSNAVTAVVKQLIIPASGASNKEVCINLDYSCFVFNGVEFYFQEWDVMTDPEMAGATYAGDAIFFPMSDTLAINPDQTTETRKKMTVWFEKTQRGSADHMNQWYRDERNSTGCEKAGWEATTALSLEVFCANQFVYVQKV